MTKNDHFLKKASSGPEWVKKITFSERSVGPNVSYKKWAISEAMSVCLCVIFCLSENFESWIWVSIQFELSAWDAKREVEKKTPSVPSQTVLTPHNPMPAHRQKGGKGPSILKHCKNCEGCPGHSLTVRHWPSVSWFKFLNLSGSWLLGIVNCALNH